jgi:hypothetical protein
MPAARAAAWMRRQPPHSEIPSETHLPKPQKTDTGTMLFGIFDKHLISE